jgi:hypothetical protein
MDLSELPVYSFIVKVWLEETEQETGRTVWRGYITHVGSGKRRYVEDLDGIVDFIVSYLADIGVDPGIRWRVRLWLSRQRHR